MIDNDVFAVYFRSTSLDHYDILSASCGLFALLFSHVILKNFQA